MIKLTESIKTHGKFNNYFNGKDIIFVIIYMGISLALSSIVHPEMQPAFMVFSFIVAVFLWWKSRLNPKRKNLESIYFLLIKDNAIYTPHRKRAKNDKEI